MKIFITGATGFIGAHTALELLNAGHELRMLVRNKQAAQGYFAQHGHQQNDFVLADMQDKNEILKGMQGCDAVLHAAAMVSLDPKQAKQVYQNNINSIDAVLGSAYETGIANIVYVSSLAALFHGSSSRAIREITEQTPLGNPKEAYLKSKRDCEVQVRKLKERGAAIQITYPSGVFGPDDPKLNESNHALITFLSTMTPRTSSGIQCVDVRDVAQVHRHLLEQGPKAGDDGRYIVAGHYYSWQDFHQLLQAITERKLFSPVIPGPLFRFMGSVMDLAKQIYPFDIPITSESMNIVTNWTPANSSKVLEKTALKFRSGADTFGDTIDWLVKAGHLKPIHAGKVLHKQ